MTKPGLIKRVQEELANRGVNFSVVDIDRIITTAFNTIKSVVAGGDQLRISGLGRFYAKEMRARAVRYGLNKEKEGEQFVVLPPKKKLGFSSFDSTDRQIGEGRLGRNMNGLFADVFED